MFFLLYSARFALSLQRFRQTYSESFASKGSCARVSAKCFYPYDSEVTSSGKKRWMLEEGINMSMGLVLCSCPAMIE